MRQITKIQNSTMLPSGKKCTVQQVYFATPYNGCRVVIRVQPQRSNCNRQQGNIRTDIYPRSIRTNDVAVSPAALRTSTCPHAIQPRAKYPLKFQARCLSGRVLDDSSGHLYRSRLGQAHCRRNCPHNGDHADLAVELVDCITIGNGKPRQPERGGWVGEVGH